ncbi:hypothetical protein CLV98_10657 [Dyadobacter jejuensis]|uniref:PAP2 superfamily protein n=1 Tax=Dyadobacter jejuensis TaxID=1082580 RepID=A0A316B4P2_9BACT|nr:hypothetical protein [Dyadobacter jejuensis]PWJ57587.1 hypothetical protein CLV98_10657 [Dyadobacter jejuensis]
MNSRLALYLSVVFHPLLITTYVFGILFYQSPDLVGVSALEPATLGSILLLLFMNTFVAPSIIVFYMHRFGLISSLHIDHLPERRWPYLSTILIYAATTFFFGWYLQPIANLAPQIGLLLGSVTLSLMVVAVVSLNWKISAHATGMGGAVGILGSLFLRFQDQALLPYLLVTIILAGALVSARLKLNAHTPPQTLAGFATGLLIAMVTIYEFF